MDPLSTENRPETCLALGLDCNTCMRKAAGSVARICGSLDQSGVQKVFLELFPSSGCRPMASTFEVAYRQTSGFPVAVPATAVAAA